MNTQKRAIVIKVGGSFFSELAAATTGTKNLLSTIAKLQASSQPVVLVHGGGAQVLQRLAALGIKSTKKDGLRVTPDQHMPIVSGVLAGELNKLLVSVCRANDINAVGISLADGHMTNCVEHSSELGAVGIPSANSDVLLRSLLDTNLVPIVASVACDNKGRLYNINADHAAICIAELLKTQLYFFADVAGVLDGDKQLIHELDSSLCESLLADEVITDGMVVKVRAAQEAANAIKMPVTIASWNNTENILINQQPLGTRVLPTNPINP